MGDIRTKATNSHPGRTSRARFRHVPHALASPPRRGMAVAGSAAVTVSMRTVAAGLRAPGQNHPPNRTLNGPRRPRWPGHPHHARPARPSCCAGQGPSPAAGHPEASAIWGSTWCPAAGLLAASCPGACGALGDGPWPAGSTALFRPAGTWMDLRDSGSRPPRLPGAAAIIWGSPACERRRKKRNDCFR